MHSTRSSDFWCDTLIRVTGTPRRARAQVRTVEGVCAVVGPRLRHRASRDGVHPHRQAAISCQPQHLPPPCQPVVQRTHQSGDCATPCLQPASVHANAIAAVLRSHKLQISGATVCQAADRVPSPAAAAGLHGQRTPGAVSARPGSADESAHWPNRPGPIQHTPQTAHHGLHAGYARQRRLRPRKKGKVIRREERGPRLQAVAAVRLAVRAAAAESGQQRARGRVAAQRAQRRGDQPAQLRARRRRHARGCVAHARRRCRAGHLRSAHPGARLSALPSCRLAGAFAWGGLRGLMRATLCPADAPAWGGRAQPGTHNPARTLRMNLAGRAWRCAACPGGRPARPARAGCRAHGRPGSPPLLPPPSRCARSSPALAPADITLLADAGMRLCNNAPRTPSLMHCASEPWLLLANCATCKPRTLQLTFQVDRSP